MVRENVTWGEERIADELSLKLGICVSPRTVKGTDCQVTAKSERRTSWAVCITNTGWNSASREPSQVSAEHNTGLGSFYHLVQREAGLVHLAVGVRELAMYPAATDSGMRRVQYPRLCSVSGSRSD